jgi:RNA polymerase sigma-70 factor (ECF subfamily)
LRLVAGQQWLCRRHPFAPLAEKHVLTSAATEHSDGTVVAAVLAGDRDRFAELVGRYHGALLRLAHSRLGRREWAEDVVQEALLNAFKSLHTYDSQYSFRTWLWTILLNQCHRHYKKQGRNGSVRSWSEHSATEKTAAQQTAGQLRSTESPVDHLLATECSERLNAMLDQLPENQADALRLRFFGGLKFREIAQTMDCSLSTAKNRVRWGLTKMAEQLGPTTNF